ncbi:hypothetical protein Tco_0848613 [Tanacetum coccineum]
MFKCVQPLAGKTFQEEFRSAGWCKENSDGQKTVAEDSTPPSMCQTISNIDAHVEGEQFHESKQSSFRNSDEYNHDPEKYEHAGPKVTTSHECNDTTRMIWRFTVADDLEECLKFTQVKGTMLKDYYGMYKGINA